MADGGAHMMSPSLFLLLAAAGCRSPMPAKCGDCDTGGNGVDADGDGFDSPSDCNDADASINPGATEIPYDGIDQDCVGADLTDVDADGQDAGVVGGTDCNDNDPTTYLGAAEVPHDGIDQDCDGADLVDVDGDGHDGTAAAGDDCNDTDASVYPGAPELHDDGADNDCDGRVDEWTACADGSGDALTIQDAVDAAPNGGTVEICAGSYSEDVVVDGKDLSIAGSGEMPDDVVWEGAGGAALTVSGGPDVDVSWVTLVGTTMEVPVVDATDYADLALSKIFFSGSDSILSRSSSSGPTLSVTLSKMDGEFGVYDRSVDTTLLVSENMANTGVFAVIVDRGDSAVTAVISNNLIVDAAFNVELRGNGYTNPASGDVERNTLVGATTMYFTLSCGGYGDETAYCPDLGVTNNIFAMSSAEVFWQVFWWGLAETSEADLSEWSPSALSGNVIWEVDGGVVVYDSYECTPAYYEYREPSSVHSSDVSEWTTSSIWEDPQFTVTDAGSHTPDPSGPAADAGAFSGANGDWYKEFPWPLD